MWKEVLIPLFYFLLFSAVLLRSGFYKPSYLHPYFSLFVFSLKVISGMLMWWIYTYYYTNQAVSDIHCYYNDAEVLFEILQKSPTDFFKIMFGFSNGEADYADYFNRMNYWYRQYEDGFFIESRTMIRFNAFLMLFSFQTFHSHTVLMCFVSFTGLMLIYKGILRFFSGKEILLAVAVFFAPSLMFWASGPLKEPILIFGLGLAVWSFFNFKIKKHQIRNILLFTLGLIFILFTKFYVFFCLVPSFIAFYIFQDKRSFLSNAIKYLVVNAILFLISFNVYRIFPEMDLPKMLSDKQKAFNNVAELWNAGSKIETRSVNADFWSIAAAVPGGIWRVLAGPFPWDLKNVMYGAAFFENLLMLIWVLFCIYFADIKKLKNAGFLFFALNFCILLFALIGITVPVMGALVRYKIPALPFYLAASLYLVDTAKLKNKLPKFFNT